MTSRNLKDRFTRWCNDNLLTPAARKAFAEFLRIKYPGGLPRGIDFDLEYRQFLAEATSYL